MGAFVLQTTHFICVIGGHGVDILIPFCVGVDTGHHLE